MSDISQQQSRTRETIAILEGRVKDGVRRFDEKGPDDWFDVIDPQAIILGSFTACPLGQVFDHWSNGCETLDIPYADSWKYGFDLGPKDPFSHEVLINAAWRRAIHCRRTAKACFS